MTSPQTQMAADVAQEKLDAVRVEGRRVKAELEALVRQVKQLDAEIALAQGEQAALDDAINQHYADKPSPEDFPSDAEFEAWHTELSRLQSARLEQSRHVMDLKHKRAYPVQRAVDLDMDLVRLQSARKNLEQLACGAPLGQFPEVGLQRV